MSNMVYIILKDEPAGKPLYKCKKIRVKLTIHHPQDLDYREKYGLFFYSGYTIIIHHQ